MTCFNAMMYSERLRYLHVNLGYLRTPEKFAHRYFFTCDFYVTWKCKEVKHYAKVSTQRFLCLSLTCLFMYIDRLIYALDGT